MRPTAKKFLKRYASVSVALLLVCVGVCVECCKRTQHDKAARLDTIHTVIQRQVGTVHIQDLDGSIPSDAKQNVIQALHAAQGYILQMDEEGGWPKIEQYPSVRVEYAKKRRGREWMFTFAKSRTGVGGYFHIWVDDTTGLGVDYLGGE
jgi:hypothetical protein